LAALLFNKESGPLRQAEKIAGIAFPWKRVRVFLARALLLVVSFLLAVAVWSFLFVMLGQISSPDSLKTMLSFFGFTSFMTVWFGWGCLFLAIPALVFFTDLRGWRFWALLALGTVTGPIYLCLPIGTGSGGHFSFSFAYLLMAAPISGIFTLIYLLLVRRGGRHLSYRNS
jgi:hypothetical protein